MALLPLNTFAHFARPADRQRVLAETRAHLVAGGRLVLDLDLEGPRRLLAQPGLLWLMGSWQTTPPDPAPGATRQVTHIVSAAPGSDSDTITVTHLYDAQDERGMVRRVLTTMTQAVLTHQELLLTLSQAGFVVEAVYGSYDLEPYRSGAERIVVVARTL
jgi:hypothetical protein